MVAQVNIKMKLIAFNDCRSCQHHGWMAYVKDENGNNERQIVCKLGWNARVIVDTIYKVECKKDEDS